MATPIVGAQLFTLRDFTNTIPDIAETLKKLGDTGYTSVQLSAIGPVDPAELGQVLKDSGLSAAATHVSWDRCLNDLDALVEEHKLWDCTHVAIGCLPGEYFCEGGVHRFLGELGPVAARLADEGMDFSYHNHHHEFMRFGNTTWLDELYSTAPADVLKAEIDTYWIQAGGGDPAAWVRRCSGRQPLLHLKDMCIVEKREQRFAPIGEGNLNWPAIFEAAEAGGVEHFLVEQDNCYGNDPFEALASSYRFLAQNGYC